MSKNNINFLKQTTVDQLKETIEKISISSKPRIHISNAVYTTNTVTYYLMKNMIIICDKTILSPISSNLQEIEDGFMVTETGLVQLKSLNVIDINNKPLLTILS